MKSANVSSGIDRRTLISGLALLPATSGALLSTAAWAQVTPGAPLSSWNEGPAKQAILDFVLATTNHGSAKFIPPEKRIATFDQDGTLWVEHPMYSQVMYCLDRVPDVVAAKPELKNVEPFKIVLSGDREAMAKLSLPDLEKILAATLTGMPVETFEADVEKWLTTAKHPHWKRLYTELTYQPMQEVLQYMRDNGFKTYIVTGGGQDFVRVYSQRRLRYSAGASCWYRRGYQIRLRQDWQTVPDQRTEVASQRRHGRKTGRYSPDDRPASARGFRQFRWRPRNAGIYRRGRWCTAHDAGAAR